MIVWFIIAVILLGISIYININLFRKNITLEQWLFDVQGDIKRILKDFYEIDDKKYFETDDEVGRMWTLLRSALLRLKEYIGDEDEEG